MGTHSNANGAKVRKGIPFTAGHAGYGGGRKIGMTLANAFIGKAKKPTDSELEAALGVSKALWDQLIAKLKQQFGLKGEWNSYSAKAGWSLRMKDGERNIVYLTPGKG